MGQNKTFFYYKVFSKSAPSRSYGPPKILENKSYFLNCGNGCEPNLMKICTPPYFYAPNSLMILKKSKSQFKGGFGRLQGFSGGFELKSAKNFVFWPIKVLF